jgi:hypothetical protein
MRTGAVEWGRQICRRPFSGRGVSKSYPTLSGDAYSALIPRYPGLSRAAVQALSVTSICKHVYTKSGKGKSYTNDGVAAVSARSNGHTTSSVAVVP